MHGRQTSFSEHFEASTGKPISKILTNDPPDSPGMTSSLTHLSSYIGDDPVRAIEFLIHLLISPGYSERHSNQHRLRAISSSLSSPTRGQLCDRFLRWCLGYQDPDSPSVRATTYSMFLWEFFNILTSFPELSNHRIREAILSEQSNPLFHADSYSLISHLYTTNLHDITTEYPELFSDLKTDISRIEAFVSDGTLELPAFIPLVHAGDSATPRCIKFGGSLPHDPLIGYPLCPVCRVPTTHILTLYVPLLPRLIQELFPDDEKETVIVVCYCEQCFLEVPVFVYRGEEIDRLVLSANLGSRGRAFNEPRIVYDWQESKSYPDWSGFERLHLMGMTYEPGQVWRDLFETKMSKCTGLTYVGGFPEFVQGPENPTRESRLLMQIAESDGSTGMWGDCGSAQLWMEVGEDYGKFQVTWACS
jgi:hypothetical protein